MDDSHHTKNRHPPKMNDLQETFLQIILAPNVRQQRRPLPSLLSDSSFMMEMLWCVNIMHIQQVFSFYYPNLFYH